MKKCGLSLPSDRIQYPTKIVERRQELLYEFEAEEKLPGIRKKLKLISRAFHLLADQMEYETQKQVMALAYIAVNRSGAGKEPVDDKVDTVRPSPAHPNRLG